jgi:hypothetical protein
MAAGGFSWQAMKKSAELRDSVPMQRYVFGDRRGKLRRSSKAPWLAGRTAWERPRTKVRPREATVNAP